MNKNKLFIILLSLSVLAGCDYNDKYFDGLDESSRPSDIKNEEYTLTEADYSTISDNSDNQKTAELAGISEELEELATTQKFTDIITAEIYLPAFLKSKFNSYDNNSVVKVTYNKETELPDYISGIQAAKSYILTEADYESAWEAEVNYFTPTVTAEGSLPMILRRSIEDPQNGEYLLVTYNYSDKEPGSTTETPRINFFEEDFESYAASAVIANGWTNVDTQGTRTFTARSFNNNMYAQVSSGGGSKNDSWLITPQISLPAGAEKPVFTFDICTGYYLGGEFTVLISTDFSGDPSSASWIDISESFIIPTTPSTSYGTLGNAGTHNLNDYIGKNFNIAFRFVGDATPGVVQTATYQVDNVLITVVEGSATPMIARSSYIPDVVERNLVYQYVGSSWILADAIVINPEDYKAMGSNYNNFSSSFTPDDYLPTYLRLNFPYAQEGLTKVLIYNYYDGSNTVVKADEYVYTENEWIKEKIGFQEATDQFKKVNSEWVFSPSVTIDLYPNTSLTEVKEFYQAIVDYVVENHGEDYLYTGRTDVEYYYGTSGRYNNLDFRTAAWKGYCPAGSREYADLEDDELTDLMFSRLPEAFIPALKKFYPDADVLPSGVDVLYTINMTVYQGSNLSVPNYTIQYKVIGKGEFEYVEDSLQKL